MLGTRAEVVGDRVYTLTGTSDAIAVAPDGSEARRVDLAAGGEGLLGGLATDGALPFIGTPNGLVALSHAVGSTARSFPIEPGPRRATTSVLSTVITGENVAALPDLIGSGGLLAFGRPG